MAILHPWIGKSVRPVDPEHIWRREAKRIRIKNVVPSINDPSQETAVLIVEGINFDIKHPLSDYELLTK